MFAGCKKILLMGLPAFVHFLTFANCRVCGSIVIASFASTRKLLNYLNRLCVISCCVILLFKLTCLQTTLNQNFHLCRVLSILSRLLIWHTRKQAWRNQESSDTDSQLICSLVLSDSLLWFGPGIALRWTVWFDKTVTTMLVVTRCALWRFLTAL